MVEIAAHRLTMPTAYGDFHTMQTDTETTDDDERQFAANTFAIRVGPDECVGCPAQQALEPDESDIPDGAPTEVIVAYDNRLAKDERTILVPESEAKEAWLGAIEDIEEEVEARTGDETPPPVGNMEIDLRTARTIARELGWMEDDE